MNRTTEPALLPILPAIDLQGGKCVRLRRGAFADVTTYSDDPLEFALRWQSEGATRLHLVDLDGARTGVSSPENAAAIRQIVRQLTIPVQLGGGIRTRDAVAERLDFGVERVILGTSAARDAALMQDILPAYGEKLVVGIDAKAGFVAVSGWQERLTETAIAFARRMTETGAKRIIFTDISRDGMLQGVNRDALEEMLAAVSIPVIASGGVGSLADIRLLREVAADYPTLDGVIIGKALYAGTVTLPDAIAAGR